MDKVENSMGRIALVEDDASIRDLVEGLLKREGFDVFAFSAGRGLFAADITETLDCVILDLMLPGEDGLTICRELRSMDRRLPILIVTAKGDPIDRVIGLELGADDYLAKPFNSRELLARVRSIIRRTRDLGQTVATQDDERFQFLGWTLRADARELLDEAGQSVPLSTGDFELLHIFVTHPQNVLSRELLLNRTRGGTRDFVDRVIDVQISRLRRKLGDDPRNPTIIRTIRGDGYLFGPKVVRC
ncbi:MAG: response regulator [Brevundimonas sp.]|mgnify:FL=1|uniref:response regulator n=1 Tax=Brevundimonas sp. TaxID=1871086 RepID=UPI002582C18D|nr:response regulator [Brevundimonas sp.]MCV0413811.1 response regulator [Brevundimonas sp.]